MPIPKIIHQIWVSGDPVWERYRGFIESWRRCNPNFEHHLWEFHNLEFEKYSREANFILKSDVHYEVKMDVVTWEILRLYGGIKADVDTCCQKSFVPLLNHKCFSGTFIGRSLTNRPEAIFKKVSDQEIWLHNNGVVGMTPGELPEAISLDINNSVIQNFKRCSSSKLHIYCEEPCFKYLREGVVFPPEYFNPFGCDELYRRVESFPNAYSIHHWGGGDSGGWIEKARGKIPKSWREKK
jgi:hypothetical protein